MKNQKATIALFSLLFLCFSIQTFGQKEKYKITIPFDSTTQKYTYEKIVEVPNKNASDIYKSAKHWTKNKYADDNYNIVTENEQLNDLGNFTINVVLKGGMVRMPYVYTVIFNINFLFKDGKCKFDITNIKLSDNAMGVSSELTIEAFEKQFQDIGMGKKIARSFVVDAFSEIDIQMLKLIEEIEAGLKEEEKPKSEW